MDNDLLPLKTRLKKYQMSSQMTWEVVERDYLLSWILHAFAQENSKELVFKGGTALRKCYFGEYRFSEDLDFTSLSSNTSSENLIKRVTERLNDQINEIEQFEVKSEKYFEKDPHPEGQEAYIFKAKFSWHRASHIKIFAEITQNENLIYSPIMRPILHGYGEKFVTSIPTYSLSEIVIEKLRAILQHTKKIHERQWNRSRARDYYDLWKIFNTYSNEIDDFKNLKKSLNKKCIPKDVSFRGSESFFDDVIVKSVKNTWDKWLEPLVPNLPTSEKVFTELKLIILRLIDEN